MPQDDMLTHGNGDRLGRSRSAPSNPRLGTPSTLLTTMPASMMHAQDSSVPESNSESEEPVAAEGSSRSLTSKPSLAAPVWEVPGKVCSDTQRVSVCHQVHQSHSSRCRGYRVATRLTRS